MKTKIIYISGNEIFDIRDIRAAFNQVRCALNLDNQTVLFGVPIDQDDAKIMDNQTENTETVIDTIPTQTPEPEHFSLQKNTIEENKTIDEIDTPKKRGRPRKENIITESEPNADTPSDEVIDENIDSQIIESENESVEQNNDAIPILSVLSGSDTENTPEIIDENESVNDNTNTEQIDIIDEISDENITTNESVDTDIDIDISDDSEPDLEKLLSEMTPLAEDARDEVQDENIDVTASDISVDATLEQLATEFVENQDKIASESKSTSRSKIGKLRNILPFKQSKHTKDQGIGDLLEWAGIAANDEDFSVPGFFTNVASKK